MDEERRIEDTPFYILTGESTPSTPLSQDIESGPYLMTVPGHGADLWGNAYRDLSREETVSLFLHPTRALVEEPLLQRVLNPYVDKLKIGCLTSRVLGGEKHSILAREHGGIGVSFWPPEQKLIPNSREVARVLIRSAGALEAVLMLADAGEARAERLIAEAVQKENLLEVVTELGRVGLVRVAGDTLSLTQQGRLVVEKLRGSLENGGKPHGTLPRGSTGD